MTVWPLQSQFGVVEIDSNSTIFSFEEKPVLDKWINIGYFYFKEEIITLIKEYDKFELLLLCTIIYFFDILSFGTENGVAFQKSGNLRYSL